MPDNLHIVLELEGGVAQHGEVLLNDFVDKLNAVKAAFDSVEKGAEQHSRSNVEYRIVNASHSSPLKITIEPVQKRRRRGVLRDRTIKDVHHRFFYLLQTVREGRVPAEGIDNDTLEAFRRLSENNKVSKAVISNSNATVSIDSTFKENIDAIYTREVFSRGSITGRLEAVNFHGETPAFVIWPENGPAKIFCSIPASQKQKAKEALEMHVRVYGKKAFRSGARFPHSVEVDRFEIIERPANLSQFADLEGSGASDGQEESTEFVRKLRDEWP